MDHKTTSEVKVVVSSVLEGAVERAMTGAIPQLYPFKWIGSWCTQLPEVHTNGSASYPAFRCTELNSHNSTVYPFSSFPVSTMVQRKVITLNFFGQLNVICTYRRSVKCSLAYARLESCQKLIIAISVIANGEHTDPPTLTAETLFRYIETI